MICDACGHPEKFHKPVFDEDEFNRGIEYYACEVPGCRCLEFESPLEYKAPDDFADLMLNVVDSWALFKAGHNIKSLKLACCERSTGLFNALDALAAKVEVVAPRKRP